MEWIVELKKIYTGIEFFGQDDKAKVAYGDTVSFVSGVFDCEYIYISYSYCCYLFTISQVPVSTGVQANTKGIVAVDNERKAFRQWTMTSIT